MAIPAPLRLGVKAALFEPGERLGWVFRDRFRLWRSFDEPPPAEWEGVPWHSRRIAALRRKRTTALRVGTVATVVCFVGFFLSLLVYRYLINGSQSLPLSFGTGFALAAWAIALVPPLVLLIGVPMCFTVLMEKAYRARDRAWIDWQARKRRHNERERDRIEKLMEWGAAHAAAGTRRIDLFGGNLWSWESFLTVYGSSMLRESPPVTVVDLSEELVSDELFQLAREAGFETDRQVLPAELAESDLLTGLDARQLVDVLIESFHGDAAGANRAERIMDARILTAVCEALGGDLSMGRVAEALRALMGEPGGPRLLAPEEWDRVTTELFSGAYVEQAHDRLRKIEAYIHPLSDLGSRPRTRPEDPRLRCLAVINEGPNPFSDLLVDLIVQWTMRQVAASNGHHASPLLVVAGADNLQRRHLERLSDLCDRRHVRLVYLFRHLREQSLQVLGGGAVGFMRLGNHEEAERAASFIGREHRFVVSSLCTSLSGGTTHSAGHNVGESDSDGRNHAPGILFRETVGFTRSQTRNWGQSYQHSEQTGWSHQTSEQRVYEYRVEPRVLQDLPDYALLVVEAGRQGPVVRAIECNPDILSLPRAGLDTLPEHDVQVLVDSADPVAEKRR